MEAAPSVERRRIGCPSDGDSRSRPPSNSVDKIPDKHGGGDGDSAGGGDAHGRAGGSSDSNGGGDGAGQLPGVADHLNPIPHDNPTVWLAARAILELCQQHTPILLHHFAMHNTYDHPVAQLVLSVRLGHVHRMQMLRRSALMEALQRGCADCRCVPASPPLTVLSCALSGSELERFSDHKVSQRSTSDLDIMHELGPVRCRLADGRWPGAPSPPPAAADDTAVPPPPLLMVEPTENPGFVLVRSASDGGLVSAATARRLMYSVLLLDGVTSDGQTELGRSGPAVAVGPSPGGTAAGLDHVTCLRLHQWPSEEFFQRPRARDWPPPAARDDIRRFGVHLVPVGSRHSATDDDEWRLSFSRAEVVAAWHLPDLYRAALKAVKACKSLLGDDAGGLKSYFIKTATLWLYQDLPSDDLKDVTEAALAVLDRLDAAAVAGALPCFFWAEINLFRFLTELELAALRRVVALIRAKLVPLMTVWAVNYCRPALQPLLHTYPAPAPLSERQARVCLARGLICYGICKSICFRADAPVHVPWCASRIPDLLRRSAPLELDWLHHHMTAQFEVQQHLLTALLVAPDDLTCRLSPLPGGLLAWDAAPLVALLTEADLERLLVKPEAVRAWCHRQLSLPPAERPAGLTDSPETARGLTQLLLNTPLLVRAVSESVPGWTELVHTSDQRRQRQWGRAAIKLERYSDCRAALEQLLASDLEGQLRSRHAAAAAAAATAAAASPTCDPTCDLACEMTADLPVVASLWREAISRQLADPEFQRGADRIGSTLLDPWRLRQYVITTDRPQDTWHSRGSVTAQPELENTLSG